MTSTPSYPQFGLEALNSSFFNSSMISADPPPFHPNMAHDGSYGFGETAGSADIGAHFVVNNMMLSSLANQMLFAAPFQDNLNASMPLEEMNSGYVTRNSCNAVHSLPPAASVNFQFDPSDVTIAHPSKKSPKLTGESQCGWISDGPGTVAVHESYYLTGFADTGFANPFAASRAAASELSLRLGSKSSSISMANVPDRSSEVSCSGLTHVGYQQPAKVQAGHGLFQPPYSDVGVDTEPGPTYPQMCSRPLHFSQVLSRSRYTRIAQEILNEVIVHLLRDVADIADSISGIGSEARAASAVSTNQLVVPYEEHPRGGTDNGTWMEAQKLRNELLKLLQLMDQKCNQCLDEIQNTTAKFSSMIQSGSGGSICAPLAQQAVSAMYRSLRKRIMGEIVMMSRKPSRGETSLSEKERSWESSFIQKHWALQQLRRGDQQSWRPQRGLPEKSVAVLKAWMFENFLRPYPKDNEKEMLAARSGLSRSQVSNWFINARVRLWKPMIEDMYEELKSSGGSSEGLAVEHLSSKDGVS